MANIDKSEWGKLHIAKFDEWVLSVCGSQHVLGWLIIIPPREIEGPLTELTDKELTDFKKIGIIAENLLIEAFNAEWFNYLQAGNTIRKLHIHLQPRYSTQREFKSHSFTDEGWGHPIKYLSADVLAPKEIVFEITKYLRKILKTKKSKDFKIEIIED